MNSYLEYNGVNPTDEYCDPKRRASCPLREVMRFTACPMCIVPAENRTFADEQALKGGAE